MSDPIRDDAEFAEVLDRVNAGCDELEAAVERRRTPQVGWWAYVCCECDLHQITTAADLAEHLMWDDEDFAHHYFATRDEAMAHAPTAVNGE